MCLILDKVWLLGALVMSAASNVGVINYGVGNLGSVLNMFKRIGATAEVVDSAEQVGRFGRLLLPGVGSFDQGMTGLSKAGMDEALIERAQAGAAILGICLGMQLLTRSSTEGTLPGLGLLDAACERLDMTGSTLRVPHMGWNWVEGTRDHPLLASDLTRVKFYFAHSYHAVCDHKHTVIGETLYGGVFTSMMGAGNVCGAQFHPEKSHQFGMRVLSNFSRWTP